MKSLTLRNSIVAFGANLPSANGEMPRESVLAAIKSLSQYGFSIDAVSRLYSNPAFPLNSGPDFVNAVARVSAHHAPQDVLSCLHAVESGLGRTRGGRWGARTIDIDLIAMDDLVLPDAEQVRAWIDLPLERQTVETPDQLILPHPRLQDRAFVLVPAAEIAPDWRHPVLGMTLRDLRDALPAALRDGMTPLDPSHSS